MPGGECRSGCAAKNHKDQAPRQHERQVHQHAVIETRGEEARPSPEDDVEREGSGEHDHAEDCRAPIPRPRPLPTEDPAAECSTSPTDLKTAAIAFMRHLLAELAQLTRLPAHPGLVFC